MFSRVAPVAALAILVPCVAAAQPIAETYIQGNLGSGVEGQLKANGVDILLGPFGVKEKAKPGWFGSAVIGRRLAQAPVSLEAEALVVQNHVKSPDLDAAFGVPLDLKSVAYGATANIRLETPTGYDVGGWTATPFAAAGVGYGRTDLSILGDHYAGDGTLWQAKAGVSLRGQGPLSWEFGYRYLHLPSYDTSKRGLDARIQTRVQAVSVGVRYVIGG
jgi:opacity protein-like surface antigen